VPKPKDEGTSSVLTRFLHSWARNKRDKLQESFTKVTRGWDRLFPIVRSRMGDENLPTAKHEATRSVLTQILHLWALNKRNDSRNLFVKLREAGTIVPFRLLSEGGRKTANTRT